MRALPRRQQPYRGSCLGTTLPHLSTLLATMYGTNTGINYSHMYALPRGNNRSGGAVVGKTLPDNKIARGYLCREYRHQIE